MSFYGSAFQGITGPQVPGGSWLNRSGFPAAQPVANAIPSPYGVGTATGAAPDPGSGHGYTDGNKQSGWKNNGPGGTFGSPGGAPAPTGDAPLAGPGYGEDWYKKYGQDLMNGPSASENLYAAGAAGSNPFYDYAQQQTVKAINDASAARGNFNSSYTMKNIGNAVADLRGQQAHELGQLAGQADTGKFGRYDRSQGYAGAAQNEMENRAKGGIQSELDLASGRSGLVNGFYGEAGRESQQANMARIEAMLKQSGLSLEQQKAINDAIGKAAGIGVSLL